MRKETYIEYSGSPHLRRGGYLPHVELDGGIYFITFNLDDALPPPRRHELHAELAAAIREFQREHRPTPSQLARCRRRLVEELFENTLEEGLGSCILKTAEYAEIVVDAVEFYDGDRYELAALVVMPNHVHVLLRLAEGRQLDAVTHSWKSFTSQEIKRLQGTLGDAKRLWREESYDRVIRTAEEFRDTLRYVLANPKKAGLRNWPWVRSYDYKWINEILEMAAQEI